MAPRRGQGRGGRGGRADGSTGTKKGPSDFKSDRPAVNQNSRGAGRASNSSGSTASAQRRTPAAPSSSADSSYLPKSIGNKLLNRSPGAGTPPFQSRGQGGTQWVASPTSGPNKAPKGKPRGGKQGSNGSARLYGSGLEAILIEPDKEAGVWKVSPGPGLRFGRGFLCGLTSFVTAQLQAEQLQPKPQSDTPMRCPPPPLSPLLCTPAIGEATGCAPAPSTLGDADAAQLQIVRELAAEELVHLGGDGSGTLQEVHDAMSLEAHVQVSLRMLPQRCSWKPRDGSELQRASVGEGSGAALSQSILLDDSAASGEEELVNEMEGLDGGMVLGMKNGGEPDGMPEWGGGGASGAGKEQEAGSSIGGEDGQVCVPSESEKKMELGAAKEGSSSFSAAFQAEFTFLQTPEGSGPVGLGGTSPIFAGVGEGSMIGGRAAPPSQAQRAQHEAQLAGRQGVEPLGVAASRGVGPPGSHAQAQMTSSSATAGPDAQNVARRDDGAAEVWVGSRGRAGAAAGAGKGGRDARRGAAERRAGAVHLSLRLERMGFTDREAKLLGDWWGAAGVAWGDRVQLRKLWLFDNELGDEGVKHVARMVGPGMTEVHLSHNRMGVEGAAALLRAVPAGPSPPTKPLWLRIEWNRVSLEQFLQLLEREYRDRGLLVDLPQPAREDAAPSLPSLPSYLLPDRAPPAEFAATPSRGCSVGETSVTAKAAERSTTPAEGGGATEGCSRRGKGGGRGLCGHGGEDDGEGEFDGGKGGARNRLCFLARTCHVRLPWISCQYQLPAEAAVLRTVRSTWRGAGEVRSSSGELRSGNVCEGRAGGEEQLVAPTERASSAAHAASNLDEAEPAKQGGAAQRGPLLLFPDTSALLSMLGAHASVARRSAVTLTVLGELAAQGLFGRVPDKAEQVFVVVTDSVAKQLDGLKQDPAARCAVRYFMGQGLDAWGPAGLNFLTVLGGHEGEGLVREHSAQVAGSGSSYVGSSGQKMDHKIVEVALFFQREILQAAGGGVVQLQGWSGTAGQDGLPPAFPVLLLSGDNAQVQLAKSHGLPAARMADLLALEQWIQAAGVSQGRSSSPTAPLTATVVRQLVGRAAVVGLGTLATRSIHQEFDGAVACLRATSQALHQVLSTLAAVHDLVHYSSLAPEAALHALRAVLPASWRSADSGDSVRGRHAPRSCHQDGVICEELVAGYGDTFGMMEAVGERLKEWEILAQTQQCPSRVLQWTSAE